MTPREVKKAKGTLQKCRDKPTPNFTGVIDFGKPPEHFGPNQKALFEMVCTELQNAKILQMPDVDLVISLCEEWGLYVRSLNVLREMPLQTDENGMQKPSAWLAIKNSTFNSIMKLVAHLGLSPAARSRIKLGAVQEKPKDKIGSMLGKVG